MLAPSSKSTLQLILFIDDRIAASDLIGEVEQFLEDIPDCDCNLQVIKVSERPDLAEKYRVVMTPALVKTTPTPRQAIAGKNLISQLESCWAKWQSTSKIAANGDASADGSFACSAELIKLSDEIFSLNQDKASLEEKLRLKDRVIAMLAHDLRNPLTVVSLAIETIEANRQHLSSEKLGELLAHARQQTKIAEVMIRDILEAAKDLNGDFHVDLRQIDLAAICEDVLSDFSILSRLEAKEQKLHKDIPIDLPMAYADADRIKQVVNNLISNAIKYTPVGGKISVVALHRTSQKIQITISDNGPGIPEEMQQLIFEDNYRLERDDAKDGYGIGLALCQRIIRSHYGQIWVDSPIGTGQGGSSFHFTLPVY
ncbi:histidine kinase [Thalassoporum mexicanum PCC 7367]|uniref:histidine kinase n=1 Tax=Thalassoporum mexicanum TaxID=3457544 RepID=UPI00029F8284|nr:histidine kinase [Pseudanabaena sp. PCC 7367]AFY68992.1 histidine kinase [Pseudanabaena sp. PCC 7367]